MKKLILGNWKMQKLFSEIDPYFEVFKEKTFSPHFKLGLAVPSIYLQKCHDLSIGTELMVGAQNVSEHHMGAFTGEIASHQLKSMDVAFSLVGHSERRSNFHESNHVVIQKAKRLQEVGVLPVLCIGETLADKPRFKEILTAQLEGVFELNPHSLVIAYEPVWAIGTGLTASLEDISEVFAFITSFFKRGGRDFSSVKVLYGGSVNEANARSIANLDHVGGLLIGGACLDPVKFEKLIATLGA